MKFEKRYFFLYIFIIFTILLSIGYLFYSINSAKSKLAKNLQNKFIKNAKYLSINVDMIIKSKINNNLYIKSAETFHI